MGSRETKDGLFEAIALMGKAFASPVRLELLDLLAQAPRSVEELARLSGQSRANVSQHLQALRAGGMVTRARAGTRVRYALAGDEALRLWLALRDVSAERVAEVERAARGDIVLLDVRPEAEYEAGHIEGAQSIPLQELERRLAELPADAEVVAYCRGPFCAYAHDAVRQLHAAGRSACRLDDGWPEWKLDRNRITEETA